MTAARRSNTHSQEESVGTVEQTDLKKTKQNRKPRKRNPKIFTLIITTTALSLSLCLFNSLSHSLYIKSVWLSIFFVCGLSNSLPPHTQSVRHTHTHTHTHTHLPVCGWLNPWNTLHEATGTPDSYEPSFWGKKHAGGTVWYRASLRTLRDSKC